MRTVARIEGEAFRIGLEQARVIGGGMPEHRGVRLEQDVDRGDRVLHDREHLFPVVLHADDGPAFLLCLASSAGVKSPYLTSGNPRAGP